jgi:hypothetical protein
MSSTSDPFPDSLLDELRAIGEPRGDELVAYLGDTKDDVEELLKLLEALVRVDGIEDLRKLDLPEEARARCETFLLEAARLPPWYDAALILAGVEMFRRHTFIAFVVLGCASLPACYCWRYEAEILGKTARLRDDVPRRIPETAQTVLDVMSEGGLAVTATALGCGVRAARKIRMIHSCIRYLQRRPVDRDAIANFARRDYFFLPYLRSYADAAAAPGIAEPMPINQEQLAATHLTFSCLMLAGYAKIGVRLCGDEQRAYLHAWNVVGYLLGMDERILSKLDSQASARRLLAAVMRRNRAASEDGPVLERALLDYMRRNIRRLAPLLHALGASRWPKLVTSRLVEPQTAEVLELELSALDRLLRVPLWAGIRTLGWLENFAPTQRFAERVFMWLSRRMWDWRGAGAAGIASGAAAGATARGRPRAPVLPPDLSRAWGAGG